MIKKITAFFAVLAFASFSSVAVAGPACADKDKDKGCDRDKVELSSSGSFDAAGSGCDRSCGKKKDGDKS